MNKRNSSHQLNLDDSLEESRILPLISAYGRYILYGLAIAIAALLIIFRFTSSSTANAELDYINADSDFQKFQESLFASTGDPKSSHEFLTSLEQILARRTDLQSKYDALIAESLILKDQANGAVPYADRTLQRTSNEQLNFYHTFAQISLLIGQGKYQESLDQANALQQQMMQKLKDNGLDPLIRGFSEQLFAMNLLRIAALQQTLKNPTEELKAWEALTQYTQLDKTTSSPEMKIFLNGFSEGKASLKQYIELRKKTLAQKSKP